MLRRVRVVRDEHLIPDFLIAAHAEAQAGRLAAIDRGCLRSCFPERVILHDAGNA